MKDIRITKANPYQATYEEAIIPAFTKEDYESRINLLLAKMRAEGLTHAIVYADREHFSNMEYLMGFDPRFEEALLVISAEGKLTLVIGNECMAYSFICPLAMDRVLYQNFSLHGQPRDKLKRLKDILAARNIDRYSRVGIIGFKFFEPQHMWDHSHRVDIPSYIMEELLELTDREHVINFTSSMTHVMDGIRMKLRSAKEIAFYEAMCCTASRRVINILKGLHPGISELAASANALYDATPISMFPIVNFGGEHVQLSLRSPDGRKLDEGDVITVCYAVRGSLVARSGLAARSEAGIPHGLEASIDDFYKPFFAAVAQWYESLDVGVCCGDTFGRVMGIIGDADKFGVNLNPGHNIGMDEWTNSPFFRDSNYTLGSGSYLQSDIIASGGSPFRQAILEDGVILADEELRNMLQEQYPLVWGRIQARRTFLKDVIGLDLQQSVLPLSDCQAVFHPFMLDTGRIFTQK